ncbi:hypothetical protein DTO280E4_5725 [Paecilomyces variotii]|nr:hypothetical protein DTO280E4_5725 [Paecilomyces variotii]
MGALQHWSSFQLDARRQFNAIDWQDHTTYLDATVVDAATNGHNIRNEHYRFRPHGPLSIPLIVGEGKTPFQKHQFKEWFESAVLRGNSASLRVLLGQIAQISVREAMLYLIAIASTGPRKRTFKN